MVIAWMLCCKLDGALDGVKIGCLGVCLLATVLLVGALRGVWGGEVMIAPGVIDVLADWTDTGRKVNGPLPSVDGPSALASDGVDLV